MSVISCCHLKSLQIQSNQNEDDYCFNLSKQGNYINCVNDLKPKRVYEDVAFFNQPDKLNPQLITCSMGSLTLEVPIFFTFTGTQKIHYMWSDEIAHKDFIKLTIIDTTVQHYTTNELYLIECQILKFPFLSSGTIAIEAEKKWLPEKFNCTLVDRPFTWFYNTTDYELRLTGRVNFQCYAELKNQKQIASVQKEIHVKDIHDIDIRRVPRIRLVSEKIRPDGHDGETWDFLDEPFDFFCVGYAPTEIIQSHPNLPWLKERNILTPNDHLYKNWNVTYTSTFTFDHKMKEIVLDSLKCKYINETIMMDIKFQHNVISESYYPVRNLISYLPTDSETCSYPITHVKSMNDSYFQCGNGFPNVTGKLYPCETMNSCQNLFRKQQENSCIKISNTIDSRGYNILTTSFDYSPLKTGQYVCEGPLEKLGAIQIYFGGDEDRDERTLSTRFTDFGTKDLMFIVLNKEKYYINDTLSGSCKVYRVYFAEYPLISIFEGDRQISQGREKVDLEFTSQTTKEKYYVRNFEIKINNVNQCYSIYCSGVLWNANDPINVSKSIFAHDLSSDPKPCSYPITHVKSMNDSYFKCGNGFQNVTGKLYPFETMNSCQNLFWKEQQNHCINISSTIDSGGYNILTTSFDDSPLRTGQYVCEGPLEKLGAIQIYFGGDEDRDERTLSTRFTDFGTKDLMFIILNKEKYYINDTLSGSCKVYRVYFAEYPLISIFEGDKQISQGREKVDVEYTSQTTKEKYYVRNFEIKINNINQSYSIYCSGVLWNANDPINVSKSIFAHERIRLSFVREIEHKELYDTDTNIELNCDPIGDPVSEISWTSRYLKGIQGHGNVFVILRGSSAVEEYTCTASNKYSESAQKIIYIHRINPGRRNIIIGIIIGFVILGILVLAISWVMRRIIIRRAIRFLTNEEIDEFFNGKPHHDKNDKYGFIDSIAYNNLYEVPVDHIFFDENVLLGVGEYGIVKKGKLWSRARGEVVEVAVKSVKEEATIEYLKALMVELKILAYIGKHNSIASLIAASSGHLKKRELYVCIELCMTCLLSYINENNYDFLDLYNLGEPENTEELMLNQSSKNTGKVLSTSELLRWSMDIAAAMDFLGIKKIVHGDLAARNVLLTKDLNVKICDFGLARQLVGYTYIKSTDCPLPWKWMAIESLSRKEFSTHSDIWGFGITLWEIFTMGEEPYGGAGWTSDFIDQLRAGLRPSKPKFASTELYKVMLETWKENPKERMSFSDLKNYFESELTLYNPNYKRTYVIF